MFIPRLLVTDIYAKVAFRAVICAVLALLIVRDARAAK
jgi:hypothetical protein